MAVTSENTLSRSARNRRHWHLQQINAAGSLRATIWRVAGWVLVEGRRRPVGEQEQLVEQLVEMATDLNERNSDDDRARRDCQ